MKKVLFSGCSFVYGVGLPLGKQDPDLFCNILSATNKNLIGREQINISVGGNPNEKICIDAAREILTSQYEYAFVCFTSYPRYMFYPTEFNGDSVPVNPWSSSNTISNQFRDLLLTLNHDSVYIRELAVWTDILLAIANSNNTKVFFINMFLPDQSISANSLSIHPWLNSLHTFIASSIDLGNDGMHPGPITHKLFAQLLNNKLNEYNT